MTHSSFRVFDWRKRRGWLIDIPKYAGDFLNASLQQRLSTIRPSCWSDDLAWLGSNHEEIVDLFASRLLERYVAFKAFHACRPIDPGSYFDFGLCGQDQQLLEKQFRKIFADQPEALLNKSIALLEGRGRSEAGKVWLSMDNQFLIERCGHYLIQGSEYIMSLAAELSRLTGPDMTTRLRQNGVPTIFEVDIPRSLIPQSGVRELAKIILAEWGQVKARKPLGRPEPPCFVIRGDIPPGAIRGHNHPHKIVDPHKHRMIYTSRFTVCGLCSSEQ